MKRKLKRIASFVLAAVMVFAMAMPAMASGADTLNGSDLSITIDNATKDHTFSAYQIFNGKLNTDLVDGVAAGAILSDVEWGNGLTDAGKAALANTLLGVETYTDSNVNDKGVAAKVAEALSKKAPADLEGIFVALQSYLNAPKRGSFVGEEYVINGLATGYYLISDNGPAGTDDAISAYMVTLVRSTTVHEKKSVPTPDKQVKDKNDLTDTESDWQDVADYDVNDKVPFQLTGTIGTSYDEYKEYYFAFHDKQSSGLTFDETSVEVYIDLNGDGLTFDGDGKLTGADDIDITGDKGSKWILDTHPTDEDTFDIIFNDLKVNYSNIKSGSQIVVRYKSTLNDTAVIGEDGNPNDMHLEYSNNPQTKDRGKTTDERVIVFTYEVDVNKVEPDPIEGDENHTKPLAGAAFELQKLVATKQADGTLTYDWVPVGTSTPGAATEFEFKRVDTGIYKLTETVVPDGHNKADDIYFEIEATYDGTTLKDLHAFAGEWNESEHKLDNKEAITEGVKLTFDANKATGLLTTDVLNQKGAQLPETGGIGTTIFYVVGSVLVLGAVILLVTKRRMKSE